MASEFDIELLRDAVAQGRLRWQLRALERLLERGISRGEVRDTILHGDIIEEYMADKPFPSCLIAQMKTRPLHVVAAINTDASIGHVVTAYRPDLEHFEDDYKTRRRQS